MFVGTTLLAASASAEPKPANVLGPSPHDHFPAANAKPAATQTLADGVVVKVTAGAVVDKAPNTRLMLAPGKTTPTHVYRLQSGRIDVLIPENRIHEVAVLVIGPNGESGVVRGGHSVAVAGSGKVRFTARDHNMLIGKGSIWKALEPGMTRQISLASRKVEDFEVPKAPTLKVRQRLMVTMPGAGFRTAVEFDPIPHAAKYQVALLKREGAKLSVVAHSSTSGTRTELSGVEPGNYLIAARALDEFGVAGAVSAATTVRVFGFELPPGAKAQGNVVLLPPKKRLPLIAAEGLKMTYGNGSYFVDAPKSVGLARADATTVRFREPSTKQEVELLLAPHVLKAQVEVGPRTARWPSDRVHVKVRLVDGAGQPVADAQPVKADVSVNLTPTRVEWKRDGNSMTGVVEPPENMRGPWVVRVEVKNQAGEVIGRDFLEIVSSQKRSGSGRQRVAKGERGSSL